MKGAFLWPGVNQHLHLVPFTFLILSGLLMAIFNSRNVKFGLRSESMILCKDWDICDDWNGDFFGQILVILSERFLKKE